MISSVVQADYTEHGHWDPRLQNVRTPMATISINGAVKITKLMAYCYKYETCESYFLFWSGALNSDPTVVQPVAIPTVLSRLRFRLITNKIILVDTQTIVYTSLLYDFIPLHFSTFSCPSSAWMCFCQEIRSRTQCGTISIKCIFFSIYFPYFEK
jgi:hypothetical protein